MTSTLPKLSSGIAANHAPNSDRGSSVMVAHTIHKCRKYFWQNQVEFYVHIIDYPFLDYLEIIVFSPILKSESRLYAQTSSFFHYIGSKLQLDSKLKAYDTLKEEADRQSTLSGGIIPMDHYIHIAAVSSHIISRVRVKQEGIFSAFIEVSAQENKPITEAFLSSNFPLKLGASQRSSIEIDRHDSSRPGSSSSANVNTTGVSGQVILGSVSSSGPYRHTALDIEYEKLFTAANNLLNETVLGSGKIPTPPSNAPAASGATGGLGLMTMLNLKRRLGNFKASIAGRGQQKGRLPQKKLNNTFDKFTHDNELFAESLSFLHVSEMLMNMVVSKKWRQTLHDSIRQLYKLVITPRPLGMKQFLIDRRRGEGELGKEMAWKGGQRYVSPVSILRILSKGAENIEHLELDRCILNLEVLQALSKALKGKTKRLSIGQVKVHPDIYGNIRNLPSLIVLSGGVPSQYDNDVPSFRTDTTSVSDAKDSFEHIRRPSLANPSLSIALMPYINGIILKIFLGECGFDITHLELSVHIKELPADTFSRTPKLRTLVPLNVNFVDAQSRLVQEKTADSLDGSVDTTAYLKTMKEMALSMPRLLQIMRDATTEALILTDNRGNICVANEGFELLTKFTAAEVNGQPFEILYGKITDEVVMRSIYDTFKKQKKHTDASVLMYKKSGEVFVAQAIVVPNFASHKGLLLNHKSLTLDFLLGMINEELVGDQAGTKTVREWLASQKTLKYHFIRLGVLSEGFIPNKLAQRAKMRI